MVTTAERKPWHAMFRLLERDERVFAVLLAVVEWLLGRGARGGPDS